MAKQNDAARPQEDLAERPISRRLLTKEVAWVFGFFFLWRLCVHLLGLFAEETLASVPGALDRSGRTGWGIWSQWDANYYMWIANNGYPQAHLPVFFPLFPLAIRLTQLAVSIPVEQVALLVNVVFGGLAAVVVYLLGKTLHGEETGRRAMVYLFLFPTAVFLAAPYAEPLYVTAAAGAFLSGEKRHWWLAGMLGATASASRLTGIFLFPALLVLYLEQRRWRIKDVGLSWLWICLVPLGLAGFGWWLHLEGHGFLAFLNAGQTAWPERKLSFNLFGNVGRGLAAAMEGRSDGVRGVYTPVVDFLALLFASGGLVLVWKKLPKAYFVYTLLVLLASIATTVTTSLNRYVLGMFPLFIALAYYGKNQAVDRSYLLAGGIGLGLFTSMFVVGYWVG